MRKQLLFVVLSIVGLLLSTSTVLAQSQRVRKADGAVPSFYAVTSAPTCGISKFTAEGDPFTLSEVYSDNEVGYITERVLAVYGDGKLFFYQPRINNSGEIWSLRFVTYKLDGGNWAFDNAVSLTPSYNNYPHYLDYDPQTKTLYGFRNGMNGTEEYVIDQTTGAMTFSRQLSTEFFYNMIVTDAYGVSYGTDYDGDFYTVDLATGEYSKIGSTGVASDDVLTGIVDPATNKLYQNLSKYGNYSLYEIDKTTGTATKVGSYAAGTNLRGIAPVASSGSGEADKQAPDVCKDLSVSFATPGSLTATLTATAPELAFDKTTALVDKVSLSFYTDESDEPFCTIDGVGAGEQRSADYTFASTGTHKVKVVASNDNGVSPAKTVSAFVGFDAPAAPDNIRLAIAEDGKYNLTWDAPAEGVNGGAIDASNIKYIVTQYPSGKLEGETTERSCTGIIENTAFADYYFGVKAVCGTQEGEEGFSNHATHGDYAEIPYYDNFSSSDTYGTYTVLNANGDATWQFAKANTGDYAAIYDGSQCAQAADDYLVLPPMNLVKGANYTITFNVASAFNQDYGNNIDVVLLKSTGEVASGKVKIGSFDNIPDYTTGISEKSFDYTATESGLAYFAFYCRSAANRKVTLYDIQIQGTNFENAPSEVSELAVVAGERGAHRATITFKAPTTDVKGNPLAKLSHIKVYRDAEKTAIKSFADVAAGESCEYVDDAVSAGNHTYKVIAITEQGPSNGISAGAFIGQGIPTAPTNFRVEEDVNDFVLSWDAPTTSTDGKYIDFDNLTYAIYYQYGLMENPSLLNGAVSGCELRVPKSMFDDYAAEHQMLLSFMIMAQTENGFSSVEATDIIYGKSYELPFKESFQDGYALTEPWGILSVSDGYVSSWYMIADGNSSKPMDVSSVDADNGMAMFYQTSVDGYEARLLTPQITAGEAENPTLSLYVYHYNSSAAANSSIQVELQYEDEEDFVPMGEPIIVYGEEGWKEHKIDLSTAECNVYRVVLRAKADKKQPIFIDNLQVFNALESSVQDLNKVADGVYGQIGGLVIRANAAYEVYTATGNEVARGVAKGSESLSLAPGLYVVKVAGAAKKCIVK